MIPILAFFALHWYASAFCQSFFLHRYGAHQMFAMSRFWERFFYLLTYATQGASFLNPRAYALLHKAHHAHSDTERDPHSPSFFRDVVSMMLHTRRLYIEIRGDPEKLAAARKAGLPAWPALDAIGCSWLSSAAFCGAYTAYYVAFAPSWPWFLLLPVHFLIGPVHGAFVNWCGHKYGYRNHATRDNSRNTFAWDLLILGECFQNNHHRYPRRPNFATRRFEFDPTYPVILLLRRLGIARPRRRGSR